MDCLIDSLTKVLPRDATHRADCAIARCLSVRLTVTRLYCVEMAKRRPIIKVFSPPGNHVCTIRCVSIPTETP